VIGVFSVVCSGANSSTILSSCASRSSFGVSGVVSSTTGAASSTTGAVSSTTGKASVYDVLFSSFGISEKSILRLSATGISILVSSGSLISSKLRFRLISVPVVCVGLVEPFCQNVCTIGSAILLL